MKASFKRLSPLAAICRSHIAIISVAFMAASPAAMAQAITMASTTSTEQSGLFGHLLPAFKQATGVDTKEVAVGTGQAIDMARRGDADVLFVHDTAAEEKFVADGPSAAELEQAKANIIGGFPLRYDSNKKLIEYVAAIGFYNLPLTWLDDYPRAVEQVTPEAVRDAYRRRVGLDHLVEVVVGGSNEPDRSKVEREQEQQ